MGAVYFAPMPITELILISLAGLGLWFWLDALKAREIGIAAAAEACAGENCQFLDETVVGRTVGIERDDAGRLRLRRVFTFEYSDTGDNRRQGSVTLLGHEVELLNVRPHLYVIPNVHHENRD